ncbi:hypothetical protein [Kumtagia ephedrae]|uniref:Uncharacterized protein n=1 Tax=Kumtagia ephedrae TaxID=2116701 RepID=A0A2P7RIC0_9HYPH|nr:hypothetical protein [Mesorhizobium ephedrae]PSJ49981.1 hypothetical protein C7I84_28950 [Mesorhizobium ephedrae]
MADPVKHPEFQKLIDYLIRVPSVHSNTTPSRGFGCGSNEHVWWVKFSIDIDHSFAWNAVQELGHVLNYLSLTEKLPTAFMPVSPPPYANGGPRDFLSWVIECPVDTMTPNLVAEWLDGRLPRPVDDLSQWALDD